MSSGYIAMAQSLENNEQRTFKKWVLEQHRAVWINKKLVDSFKSIRLKSFKNQ